MDRTVQTLVPEELSAALADVPESGMGYHLVNVVLRDGRRFWGVPVYNLAMLELPEAVGKVGQDDIIEIAPARSQSPH